MENNKTRAKIIAKVIKKNYKKKIAGVQQSIRKRFELFSKYIYVEKESTLNVKILNFFVFMGLRKHFKNIF